MFAQARPRKYRVIREYQAAYPDPLVVRAGEWLTVTDRGSEWPGWLWCENRERKGGWVPEAYLRREGGRACARRIYVALELTVHAGDELAGTEEESGWVWCSDRQGRSGWVPLSHLEGVE